MSLKFKGHGTFWIRTCQECGKEQNTKPPSKPPTDAWLYKTCTKCQSEGLDYGCERTYIEGIEQKYEEIE